jgi:DNA-binding FrmR family transcriptional regulator
MIIYTPWGYTEMQKERKKILDRLRRIEGQVRGLQRLIENEAECVNVLVQVAAVTAALKRTGTAILSAHMEQCLKEASNGHGEGLEGLKKALKQFIDAS